MRVWKDWPLLCLVLFFHDMVASSALAEEVKFIGQVPDVVVWQKDAVSSLTHFVGKIAGVAMPEVTVYFVPFGGEERARMPNLLVMQRAWLKEFLPKEPGTRLSNNVRGFHYDHTTIIQLAPSIFIGHFIQSPTGGKPIVAGAGFYVLGHELMHVAFERKGVPGLLHHCLFIKNGYSERLARYVSDHNLAHPVVVEKQYLQTERDLCTSPSG